VDFEVVWSTPAIADIEAILGYDEAQSPAGAISVGEQIADTVAGLKRLPFLGAP
jgi:plasmid stabilization system protein ParE